MHIARLCLVAKKIAQGSSFANRDYGQPGHLQSSSLFTARGSTPKGYILVAEVLCAFRHTLWAIALPQFDPMFDPGYEGDRGEPVSSDLSEFVLGFG